MNIARTLLVLLLSFPLFAVGQGVYPDKPIRVIVPFPPGGGVDNFVRPLAQKLSEQFDRQIIIDNRGGAGGVIGSAIAAKAAPDGYTLLASTDTSVYLTTLVVKNASYDPIKDLTPIISAAITPTVVVVHPSSPVRSMKDLVDLARKSPEPLPYVTAGVGSLHHLAGESLARATSSKLLHVAYKGGGPALTDLLGGQVKTGILILSSVAPYIQSGKLRVIATIENHRSKSYQNIPTISESGVPGFAMPDTAIAIWGPAGMAPEIVQRVNSEVRKAMLAPTVRDAMEKGGYEPRPGTPKDFSAQALQSYATYQRMVKEAKLSNE